MSIYDGVGFSYSLRASDATNIPPDEADILDARDRQLTDFTSNLKTQVVSGINSRVSADLVRFGTATFALPAVGGTVDIYFADPFAPGSNYFVVISNGDYAVNTAVLEAGLALYNRFEVYRVSGGVTGNNCRVNYVAFIV